MISAANPISIHNPAILSADESSADVSTSQSSPSAAPNPDGADELSISQPDAGASFRERTSLKIRNRSQVKINEDGRIRAKSQTKLRFQYEFEADDGTRIRIRAKANLRYTQTSDADQSSQTIKLRAKIQFSFVQQDVSSGLAPLLEGSQVSEAAQQAISQALEVFQQLTDFANSQFLESDPLDGDRLIAEVVEAFNSLIDAVRSTLESSPADPITALPGNATGDDSAVTTTASAPIETVEPVDVAIAPLPVLAAPDAAPPDESENKGPVQIPPQERVELAEVSDSTKDPILEIDDREDDSVVQPRDLSDEESPRQFVESVLFKARLRVIHSLSELVNQFESDSPSPRALRVDFKASVHLFARYELSGVSGSARASSGARIDAQV